MNDIYVENPMIEEFLNWLTKWIAKFMNFSQ
jgi:hypothetical protein